MPIRLLMAVALMLAAGCQATSRQVYMQDGSQAYRIECEGVDPCYDKAGELCKGKGYSIVDQSAGPLSGGSVNRSVVVVRCRR